MKVLVSAHEGNINGKFSERFARAEYFIVYDTETKEHTIINNEYRNEQSGVGVKVAQFIADEGIEAAISGHFGPKVYDSFKNFGVKMFTFKGNTVQDAINDFLDNKLQEEK